MNPSHIWDGFMIYHYYHLCVKGWNSEIGSQWSSTWQQWKISFIILYVSATPLHKLSINSSSPPSNSLTLIILFNLSLNKIINRNGLPHFQNQKGKRILANQGCCSWTINFCIENPPPPTLFTSVLYSMYGIWNMYIYMS